MVSLTNSAIATIESYKTDLVIMEFVRSEALEKVAEEVRAQFGGGTTAKAVELLAIKHKNIAARVDNYVLLGLIGCYLASFS